MAASFDCHGNMVKVTPDDAQPGWIMKSKQVVVALSALGQETRLEIFRLLVRKGPDGLAAGAIALALDLPPSSLTFHVQALTHAGLLTQRRLSRQVFYATDFAAMNAMIEYLTENCCGGNPALCAPRTKPAKPPAAARRKARAAA